MGERPDEVPVGPERRKALEKKAREWQPEDVRTEKEKVARLSRIRQFMFGSLDGLLVPLGVVSGVAGGTANSKIVVIAGVAEAFAGALSMGAGEYLSGKAESQVQQAAIRAEREEIATIPEIERREIAEIFENEGLSPADAKLVAEKIATSETSWVNTMIEKELGLNADPAGSLWGDSLAMGFSYMLASLVPLGPYIFLPVKPAFILSVALTALVLIVLGAVKGRLARMSIVRSAAEVLAVGLASAAGGYLLGSIVPKLLHL